MREMEKLPEGVAGLYAAAFRRKRSQLAASQEKGAEERMAAHKRLLHVRTHV